MAKKTIKKECSIIRGSIVGELVANYRTDYGDGVMIPVYTVLTEAKYLKASDGLRGHMTAAVTTDKINICHDGDVVTVPAGAVIIIMSKKSQNCFRYSKKARIIINRYEAAKAYFYANEHNFMTANLDAEEFAIRYLAESTAEKKMLAITVFNVLAKHDKISRKLEMKYFKNVRKALKNIDLEDEGIELEDGFEEVFNELAGITT